MPVMRLSLLLSLVLAWFAHATIDAQELDELNESSQKQLIFVEPDKFRELVDSVRPSLVNITPIGRDGKLLGTGSGFVVDAEKGLIATNYHVLGEARPVEIELNDGTRCTISEIYASDEHLDLAILRIAPDDLADLDLKALDLGDSDAVKQGEPILGFGSPQGLKFSVVSGLISAIRKLDERYRVEGEPIDFPMIQIAMPIEMGNSGGPIIDYNGKVQGLVTIKSVVTDNLGFAVPVNHLKTLLEKPNPIAMDAWLTIGGVNPNRWTPIMGGNWSQRGGTITAQALGDGFGGRTLCLAERELPGDTYEISARVKLEDESGAAGLAFASDGDDVHYGFYPSNGAMRLTRFEGPSVYTWTILDQVETTAYRRGEWNHLRLRVEPEKISGWVNGELVLERVDGVFRGGKVGLCKFRNTLAEFRDFRLDDDLSPPVVEPGVLADFEEKIDSLAMVSEPIPDLVETLSKSPETARRLLDEQAKTLEARAEELRKLRTKVHLATVAESLRSILSEPTIDLAAAALQIARLDNPELDVDYYLGEFDRLAEAAIDSLPDDSEDADKLAALSDFLFNQRGFHGTRTEYDHQSNSYIDHVLEHREGLPIALSVVFIELARRLEIAGVSGVPLPGHFIVGYQPTEGEALYIDPFDRGTEMNRTEAERLAIQLVGVIPDDSHFEAASEEDILVRMLRNLTAFQMQSGEPAAARNYIELLLAISPDESQERFQRALFRVQEQDISGAKQDFDFLLENPPAGIDYGRLKQFRNQLDEME